MSSFQRFAYFYAAIALITILNVLVFRRGSQDWSNRQMFSPKEESWAFATMAVPVPPRQDGSSTTTNGQQPVTYSPKEAALAVVKAGTSPKSYMFALVLPEQLTMCTIHFHQLLNLVNDWNFTGVEPFEYESTMFGLRSLHYPNPYGSIPFNKLYNVTMHNSYLSECMKREQTPYTPFLFEPLIEFLLRSYRKLVLIYFAGHYQANRALTIPIYYKMESEVKKESNLYSDCSSAAQSAGMFKRIELLFSNEINLERSHPTSPQSPELINKSEEFKVVQAFCVKHGNKMSLRDLRNFVFKHMIIQQNMKAQNPYDHGVSIVFISWQGRFTRPLVDSEVKNYINVCRLPFSRPFHSDYVKTLAKRYLESQLSRPDQPYLSVHVRFEKLFYYVFDHKVSMSKYLDCCMKRANSLISLVAKKFTIDKGNILLNWDYSPYGSRECPVSKCVDTASVYMKKLNIKPSYFQPSKFGIPVSYGLISLVEMDALNGGKALVTVGEGSYQYTLIQSFIHSYQDSDDHKAAEKLHYGHLCILPEELHELATDLGEKC